MAATILFGGQDVDIFVHQHRSANGYFSKITYHFPGLFFLHKFYRRFFGHSLLSYSKRRHLSTSRVIHLMDCHQSLYHQHRILSTFFHNLCFIWQSHRFQFLGCALPIGFWQLLMNLQNGTLEGEPRKLFQSWKKCDCPYETHFSKSFRGSRFSGFLRTDTT